VIGYNAPCKINWSCLKITACLVGAPACLFVCGGAVACPILGDEVACVACLLYYVEECNGPCDYVEFCEEDDDNRQEKPGPVFTHFGGGNCTG